MPPTVLGRPSSTSPRVRSVTIAPRHTESTVFRASVPVHSPYQVHGKHIQALRCHGILDSHPLHRGVLSLGAIAPPAPQRRPALRQRHRSAQPPRTAPQRTQETPDARPGTRTAPHRRCHATDYVTIHPTTGRLTTIRS